MRWTLTRQTFNVEHWHFIWEMFSGPITGNHCDTEWATTLPQNGTTWTKSNLCQWDKCHNHTLTHTHTKNLYTFLSMSFLSEKKLSERVSESVCVWEREFKLNVDNFLCYQMITKKTGFTIMTDHRTIVGRHRPEWLNSVITQPLVVIRFVHLILLFK